MTARTAPMIGQPPLFGDWQPALDLPADARPALRAAITSAAARRRAAAWARIDLMLRKVGAR